jgi:peptidoglycan hydrolase-like protein with peptidoglycan-binding domain
LQVAMLALAIGIAMPALARTEIGRSASEVDAPQVEPLRLAWCQQMGGYATYEDFYRAQREKRDRARAEMRNDQEALQRLGYYRGRVDGVSGPQMRAAVTDFRRTNGLPPGSSMDVQTRSVLTSSEAKGKQSADLDQRQVQQMLTDLGYYRGPIDGISGPQTRAAVAVFRQEHDLPPGGKTLDTRDVVALREAHAKVR